MAPGRPTVTLTWSSLLVASMTSAPWISEVKLQNISSPKPPARLHPRLLARPPAALPPVGLGHRPGRPQRHRLPGRVRRQGLPAGGPARRLVLLWQRVPARRQQGGVAGLLRPLSRRRRLGRPGGGLRGHCSKLLETARNCTKLLETAGNCSKQLETARNCSKQLETAGNS